MHYVRLIVISFIILLLLITGISLLIPQHMRISRTVSIAAPKDSVLAQIRDAAKWKNWYPGLDTLKPYMADGKIKGAIFDDSDPSHPVYIAITEEKENEVLATFVPRKVNSVVNGWSVAEGATPGTTTLQWYMNFHLRWYPWEKFASLTLEKIYGPPMEEGLANLKRIVEN
jgi:hypothetical protein